MSAKQSEGTQIPTVRGLFEALAKSLKLEILAGANGLDNQIESPRIQKLGLALAGYTDYLHSGRVQFIGRAEVNYLQILEGEARAAAIDRILVRGLSCIVVTKGLEVPEVMLAKAGKNEVPVLRTAALSSRAIEEVTQFLEEELAPSTTVHGVFLEIFGLGVLVLGKSGIGKSECGLELVLRGHRLVTDDVVVVRRFGGDCLEGSGPGLLPFHMELRGVGIINIKDLFGISAVSSSQEVELVVELEEWHPDKEYERLGLDVQQHTLLGVSLPLVTLPVASGRNVATLVEVAVRLQMLKKQGYVPAVNFTDELRERLREVGGSDQ